MANTKGLTPQRLKRCFVGNGGLYHDPLLALFCGVIHRALLDHVAGNGDTPEPCFWNCPVVEWTMRQEGIDPVLMRRVVFSVNAMRYY